MSKYVDEKSDSDILPMKPSNKEGLPSAETVEGRTLPEGNSQQNDRGPDAEPGYHVERLAVCAPSGASKEGCAVQRIAASHYG
jgi:hypothetical protein